MTLEEYKQIAELVKYNYNVLRLIEPDSTTEYWVVTEFDPSTSASSSSIDFNTFYGVNVTQFINTNKIALGGTVAYLQQFNNYVGDLLKIRVKFGRYQTYNFYGK